MFGRKDNNNPERLESIVGPETEIKGTLVSKGMIRIDGKIEGDIQHTGDLIIGPKGVINANIIATNLTLAGSVFGDLDVQGRLELLSTARLVGDIRVGSLVVADGAHFQGASVMRSEGQGPETAAKKGY